MPIVIKKQNGQTKEIARAVLPKPQPQSATIADKATPAEAWAVVKNKTLEVFCAHLQSKESEDISYRAEVIVAYHLGLGSPEARKMLEHENVVTDDWQRLLPWFAQPFGTGETLLPPGSTWEVHAVQEAGGMSGYATVGLKDGTVLQASAKSPWAALAICLMRATAAGLLSKSEPAADAA